MNELLALCLGVFSWSFAEYALHYWGGHLAKGKNTFSKEHLKHHAKKDYFSPHLKKSIMAIPVVLGLGLLSSYITSVTVGLIYTLSFTLTYIGYEVCHYRFHAYAPKGPLGRYLRKHHFHHHFSNPWTNQGVTSPIWDYVFRTKTEVNEVIVVPRTHILTWLVNEQGLLKEEYAQDYQIKQYT